MASYLAGEEATHSDDAEDVKDGGAHDGPHAHVAFGDKHACRENEPAHKHTHVRRWVVHYLTYAAASTASAVQTNRYHTQLSNLSLTHIYAQNTHIIILYLVNELHEFYYMDVCLYIYKDNSYCWFRQ